MLDMNDASEQKEMGSGNVIPPDSIVMLQISIRQPGEFAVGSHPALTMTRDAQGEYLGCDVHVVTGRFEGSKWVECFNVKNKSDTAVKIGMAALRAIVEAARGIKPQDATPAAMTARRLQNDYYDFEGMTFPAKIGCEISKDGKYVNNKIKMIITPDMEAFDQCSAMGEVLTTNPIPTLPAQGGAAPAPGGKPSWAGNGVTQGTAPVGAEPAGVAPTQTTGKPKWAQ